VQRRFISSRMQFQGQRGATSRSSAASFQGQPAVSRQGSAQRHFKAKRKLICLFAFIKVGSDFAHV
jgi:hypothetical protein